MFSNPTGHCQGSRKWWDCFSALIHVQPLWGGPTPPPDLKVSQNQRQCGVSPILSGPEKEVPELLWYITESWVRSLAQSRDVETQHVWHKDARVLSKRPAAVTWVSGIYRDLLISSKNRSRDFKEGVCKIRWEGADRWERNLPRLLGRQGALWERQDLGKQTKAENSLAQLSKWWKVPELQSLIFLLC